MTISPFGWANNSAPFISAANLEAMLAAAGAYTDSLGKGVAPNPFQYGAKGDGVTDDTTALTNFLAAGYTYGEIPPGIFLISSGLTLPNESEADAADKDQGDRFNDDYAVYVNDNTGECSNSCGWYLGL